MESDLYRIRFIYHNASIIDKFLFERCYKKEFMEAYHNYANMANLGVTERLNKEFEDSNPGYFEKNQGKDWIELVEYNQFMADGYNKYICETWNLTHSDGHLEYFVDPDEVAFSARFKRNPEATIDFVLVKA